MTKSTEIIMIIKIVHVKKSVKLEVMHGNEKNLNHNSVMTQTLNMTNLEEELKGSHTCMHNQGIMTIPVTTTGFTTPMVKKQRESGHYHKDADLFKVYL